MTREQMLERLRLATDVGQVKHEEFADYVIALSQRKKNDEGWITLETPYMTVDGKLAMANTDHARQNKRLDFANPQVLIDNEEQLTLMVIVTSEVYGTRHGIATSRRVGGNAPEREFSWEVAETSAIGRALGQFGYGLLPGTGLASAEDMQRAGSENSQNAPRRNQGAQRSGAPSNGGASQNNPRQTPPLSPVQSKKLVELWRVLHNNPSDTEAGAGLDEVWKEVFQHGIDTATYEEGARLTGQFLSELRNRTAAQPEPPAPHWSDDAVKNDKFTAAAKELGYDLKGVLRVLGLTSMRDYKGSGNDALSALRTHKETAKP